MKKQKKYLIDKKEFIFLDIFKFVCALLVVTIHLSMFDDISKSLSFWTDNILARIAVPIFFIASGFLIAKKIHNKKSLIEYSKRIICMYIIYTIIYLPQLIYTYIQSENSFAQNTLLFFKNIITIGTYPHLWYFLGLIIACWLVYFCVEKIKLSDKKILIISGLLYMIGTLGDSYQGLIKEVSFLSEAFESYKYIFTTTRNGLFFGFFLVFLGYLIYKYRNKIKLNQGLYALLSILFFIIMNIEVYSIKQYTTSDGYNMLFFIPIVATLVFLFVLSVNIEEKFEKLGVLSRKVSILIFGFHLAVDFYVIKVIEAVYIPNSLISYLLVIVFNIILAIFIINFQKYKKLRFLKYLY